MKRNSRDNREDKDLHQKNSRIPEDDYFDPDSLKEKKGNEDYLKEMAALTAVFGVGAAGLAFTPNKVHAAESVVDNKSQANQTSGSSSDVDNESQKSLKNDESNSSKATNSSSEANKESTSDSQVQSKSVEDSTSAVKTENSSSKVEQNSVSNSVVNKKSSSSESNSIARNSSSDSKLTSSSNSQINSETDSTSNSSVNSSSLADSLSISRDKLNTLDLSDKKAVAKLFGASFVQTNNLTEQTATINGGTDVSDYDSFSKAISNTNVSIINLTKDITITSNPSTISRNLTINGNGHKIYYNSYYQTITNNDSKNHSPLNVNVNNAEIYGTSTGTYSLYGTQGDVNLVLKSITFTGGTAVWTDTNNSYTKNVKFEGNNSIKADNYTDASGTNQTPNFWAVDGQNTQLYVGNNVTVADGATLNVDGNNRVQFNILEKDNDNDHSFIVGNNANVTLTGSTIANVNLDQSVNGGSWNNHVNIGDGATVNMTAPTANIVMRSGASGTHDSNLTVSSNATVNLTTTNPGSNSGQGNVVIYSQGGYYSGSIPATTSNYPNNTGTINIEKGASVNMVAAGKNTGNIVTDLNNLQVNINDPESVHLQNHGGAAYQSYGSSSQITVKADNTNVTTVDFQKNSSESQVLSGSTTVIKGTNTAGETSTSIDSIDGNDVTTEDKDVLQNVNNNRTTNVTYNGGTQSSISKSISNSIVDSISDSQKQVESDSTSKSIQDSQAASAVKSQSIVNSENSASNSIIQSQNASASAAQSTQKSINESTSVSNSIVQSQNASTSTAQSEESQSNSIKESQTASANKSQSLANSESASVEKSQNESANASQSKANSESE